MAFLPYERPRISVMTYNLWNTEHLDARVEPLREFCKRYDADVIGLQEVRPETLKILDGALPNHARVTEYKGEQGWDVEGQIYWRRDLFDLVSCGTSAIGHKEKHRRLFWVVLKLKRTGHQIFVSNTHLTWHGHHDEVTTGVNARIEQTHKALQVLKQRRAEESLAGVFFMGDLNDHYHPRCILTDNGFQDSFAKLGCITPPTWPAPYWNWVEMEHRHVLGGNGIYDYIFADERVKAICTQVVEFAHKGVHPSDHLPVIATFELKPLFA